MQGTVQGNAAQIVGSQQPSGNGGAALAITPADMRFGDADQFAVVFAAAGDTLALPRPQGRRVLLIIQNMLAAGNVGFAFGRAADAGITNPTIAPGLAILLDQSVPQNELHIFAPGAGTVIVQYMNVGG